MSDTVTAFPGRHADQGFHSDPQNSMTMAAPYYYDPAIYEREWGAIFHRTWNLICNLSKVRDPGTYATGMIGDQNILVIRGKDGELRAFYNVCQHRGHELLKGSGKANFITCPYHAWTYRSDGTLRTARGSEAVPDFDPGCFGLKPVQVEVFAGFVFVNLDPEAASLKSQTGDLEAEIRAHCPRLDELQMGAQRTYDAKSNWKVLVDNFLECYHCAPAHPAFVELVDMKTYRSKTYGIHSSHFAKAGATDNAAYSYSKTDSDTGLAAWFIWPNTFLIVFAGSDNLLLMHVLPTGPETTFENFEFYFLGDAPSEEETAAVDYTDKVLQPEDIALCESVQRGLRSRGYHQGRFIVDDERSGLSEHAVHHFHGLVLDALAD